MTALCRDCYAPAVCRVGAIDYCSNCRELLLAPIRLKLAGIDGLNGVFMRHSINRPEHGPGMCECKCNVCGATAVAEVGQPCDWCAEHRRQLILASTAQMLIAPDIDPDEQRYTNAIDAWGERLARNEAAGLITEAQIDAVWAAEKERERRWLALPILPATAPPPPRRAGPMTPMNTGNPEEDAADWAWRCAASGKEPTNGGH